MAQCEKYPDGCNGKVERDEIDGHWYCQKHFYSLDHLKETGRK